MSAKRLANMNAIDSAIEHGQGTLYYSIDIRRLGPRRRKSSESREFVHQIANRFRGAAYRFRAIANYFKGCRVDIVTAVEMPENAVRGERNRSERIFDFVGHAPRHFPPRRLFLSAK